MHNFQIVNTDTDSISFCKPNGEEFSKTENEVLLKEINSLSPDFMIWDDDGLYLTVIVLKAKNYIMVDQEGKRKIKGSALKSSTLEPLLKLLLNEIVELLISDEKHKILSVYQKYKDMVENIEDITPWCSKKTLSPTTYKSTRKNETDIIDALKGSEYVSGDRVYLYTCSKIVETGEFYKAGAKKGQAKTKRVKYLKLKENFANDYCREHYNTRLEEAVRRFEPVLGKDFFK